MYKKSYYAGNCKFDNQSLDLLADVVITELNEKGRTLEEVVEELENDEELCVEFEYLEETGTLHLYERNLDEDGNIVEFDRITIFDDTWGNDIGTMVDAAKKYINPTAEYEITELSIADYAIWSATEGCLEEGNVIDGKTVIEIIKKIAEYLYSCEPNEAPVFSEDPYAWGKDGFYYEISENGIVVETEYVEQERLFKEIIRFEKLS